VKRAAKISLLVFGGIAVAAGFVVWDSTARAARAVRAHEERLAADLAALRAKPTLPAVPLTLPLPQGFLVPTLSYEKAHSGQEPLFRQYVTMGDLLRQLGWTVTTPEQLFQQLMISQESLREGGFMAYELRRLDEERGLRIWKSLLENQYSKADELRYISSMLDQLLAARPSARDVLLGESVLDRQEILNWKRSQDASYWMLVDAPGWREMYSRTLLAVKALNEVRELETLVLGIESLPILERETKAIEEGQKNLRSNRFARSDLAARSGALFQGERLLLTEWALARVATAIVRFQVDQRRNPAELRELAPEYLNEVPVNAYTGEPFVWDKAQGVLETRPGGQGLQSQWKLGRP
jgi:hypothetical protein